MKSSKVFLLFFLLSAIQVVFVTCAQFQVGENHGWEVPSDHDMYNEWASKKRFKVDDTLNFIYKKNSDSVLEVTEAEYKRCHSDKPIFKSSNGDSIFKLDRSGSFYFISGIPAHCEKGHKLIVEVLGSPDPGTESPPPAQSKNQTESPPPAQSTPPPTQSTNQTENPPPSQTANQTAEAPAQHDHKNNAVAMHAALAIAATTAVFSFLGVFFC